MLLFATIMILAAYSMLQKKTEKTDVASASFIRLGIQTFSIGVLIGLVGAGGGFLIIPALVLFIKLPMKKAVATSLFIITLNSLIGFLGDVQNLTVDWPFLLSFTSLSVVGIFIGIYLNQFVNESQLKKGFAYFVLVMAAFILVREITVL